MMKKEDIECLSNYADTTHTNMDSTLYRFLNSDTDDTTMSTRTCIQTAATNTITPVDDVGVTTTIGTVIDADDVTVTEKGLKKRSNSLPGVHCVEITPPSNIKKRRYRI